MTPDDLLHMPAAEQARRVRADEVDAARLLRWQREAIARDNPAINAYVQLMPEGPPTAGSSPLAGSTFAVKDNIDVLGLPSHSGLRALHAQPAARSASVVQRLEAGGLTCLGKLNQHAMALGATNHNADFGDCHNPLRLTHTPGGSSGGSGAAVAAGLCGIALGTDTMGSVRVPAAYCGVVGFKPSFDALPLDGVMPLASQLDHVGVLARSVEDVRHAFALLGPPPSSFQGAAGGRSADPSRCELGVPDASAPLGATPEVAVAFEAALQRLRARGWRLRPVSLPIDRLGAVRRAGLLLSEAQLAVTLAPVLADRRHELPADLLAAIDYGAGRSAVDLARALLRLHELGHWVTRTLETVDALLLPTTPQTAFAMDAPVPVNQADFTVLANLAGAPAISLPLPVPAGALPVGLQAIARRGLDLPLLDIATLLEKSQLPGG
jgi:aspartyl-tRNA(Asn)/glutamyl-tRNA(Gln) amidotransferase subunit A